MLVCACVCVSMHTYMNACVCVVYLRECAYVHACLCVCGVYLCEYAYICTYMLACVWCLCMGVNVCKSIHGAHIRMYNYTDSIRALTMTLT